ncbi:SurA N-terminal domain-containing protein [Halotalea alkalilenta]|uniref:SurA N-terminal domain-containing protein n=1 Tax=Halotalea alkalilenta TaxID=376489 RepID=UPI000488F652|nr:SurA N-terminal domain-containing protein [Halotalea alkalilenta]
MLQDIRDRSKGWGAKIIVGVIVVVFALFGLESLGYLLSGSSNDAATVNGEGISRQTLDEELMRAMRMGQLPPGQEQAARGQFLDQLIQRELLSQYAHGGGMGFSDGQIDQLLVGLPDFHDQSGRFSSQMFLQRLAQIGHTPESFRAYLREDMVIRQLQDGFGLASFSTPSERSRLASLSNETRSFRYATLSPSDLGESPSVDEAELQAYYDAHQAAYLRPEQVRLDYILLDKSMLAQNIEVNDQELREEYARQAADVPRQVSDIVISIDDQRDEAGARELAATIQSRLAEGEDFAALAREFSDDSASAGRGGDLGSVTPGIFGDPFDSTITALEVGQVGEPILFDGALHLLKVTGLDMPSFDDLRDQLADQQRMQRIDGEFQQLAQELYDQSFTADDLSSVAEATDLPLQHSEWISRDTDQAPFAEPGVMDAAFSSQVLEEGFNSDVLELGDDRRLVLRVAEHRDQETLPFEQVRDQVREAVIFEKNRSALAQRAEQLIESLRSGEQPSVDWQRADAVGRDAQAPERAVIDAAFSLPRPQQEGPRYGRIALEDGREVVIALDQVGTRDDAAAEGQIATSLRRVEAQSAVGGLFKELNERAEIERH